MEVENTSIISFEDDDEIQDIDEWDSEDPQFRSNTFPLFFSTAEKRRKGIRLPLYG